MTARAVLSESDIDRTLRRIAHEIIEASPETSELVLLGIPTRGVVLASRLAAYITEISGIPVPSGSLDVTMYRDDLSTGGHRTPAPTEVPGAGIDDRVVVLVDDVLYSGRTIRAALDALTAIGRPRLVRLAVLVDRGHRELPIRADHVGKNLPTHHGERITVKLREIDGTEEVQVVE
ncbi:MAG: bifunctional pyr operon transcriptional regulator/uracil phosphoribosyltransferase PyrR [Pontimonas sp.]|jgi:pyrimidine operon attenuation protein / uracil phosphoribosyltransferase|nr:bifunctional pyr operon transcriptional regulator/uracil phosphoribosyltransferase PyrR [Pontimonas sp.]